MANSIELVSKYLAILMRVYKRDSITAFLDAITQKNSYVGANEVKMMKMTLVGLGNYSRVTGYPAGDLNAEWVTQALAAERGRAFNLDRMDNEESLGLVLGSLLSEWSRLWVAPELDAYRFAKWASAAGILTTTGATLDANTVKAAIAAAKLEMDEAEVPEEGRILFMTPTVRGFLEQAIGRTLANESAVSTKVLTYNDMQVRSVPQNRFYTSITLNPGSGSDEGGYVKTPSTGKDINFMIIHPSAVSPVVKLNNVKHFPPEVNQLGDGHLIQSRLYHDAFVVVNHEKGIYLHKKA